MKGLILHHARMNLYNSSRFPIYLAFLLHSTQFYAREKKNNC
jgi:hypothetical protein